MRVSDVSLEFQLFPKTLLTNGAMILNYNLKKINTNFRKKISDKTYIYPDYAYLRREAKVCVWSNTISDRVDIEICFRLV